MRVIIKGADFSQVSIGKVVKDLSFEYLSGSAINTILANPIDNVSYIDPSTGYTPGSHNASTTFYMASASDASYTVMNNTYRLVSDFIEVTSGMTISGNRLTGRNVMPIIICYNKNKELIEPPVAKWTDDANRTFTYIIPNNVAYIKIQTEILYQDSSIKGTMPTS